MWKLKTSYFATYLIFIATFSLAFSTYDDEMKAARTLFDEDRKLLVSTLAQCQGNVADEEGKNICRRAEYVLRVDGILDRLRRDPQSQSYPQVPKVNKYVNESYQSLFENYVMRNVPFKGKLPTNTTEMLGALDTLLSGCKKTDGDTPLSPHFVNGDFSLSSCAGWNDLKYFFTIPTVAFNSYNVRISQSQDDTKEESSSVMSFDLASHWPSLLEIPAEETVSISLSVPRTCPHDMHMLVWAMSRDFNVHLFPRDRAAHLLSPTAGHGDLHHIEFRPPAATGSGEAAEREGGDLSSSSRAALHTDVSLLAGEDYLFIPHDYLASFSSKSQESASSKAFMLQLCFFDASNLNAVRESLTTEALLSLRARTLLSRLQPGRSGSIDLTMTRTAPTSLSYEDYFSFPRSNVKQMVENDFAVPTSVADEKNSATPSKQKGRDRSKAKGGSNSFRDWQDSVKWSNMVTSLTLPQPATPRILQIGRTNFSTQWTNSYFPSKQQDASSFGFNLTVCEAATVQSSASLGHLPGRSAKEDYSVLGCVVTSYSSGMFASMSSPAELAIAFEGGDESRNNSVTFRTLATELRPDTSYMARLSIYLEGSGSIPSPWTEVFATRPCTVPSRIVGEVGAEWKGGDDHTEVQVEFKKPYDDGGLSILGYHVYKRSVEGDFHHAEWMWHTAAAASRVGANEASDIVRITVGHLVPHVAHEFQVASFNELGNSSLSSVTKRVTTAASAGSSSSGFEVLGSGHERHFDGLSWSNSLVPLTHWATINDEAQTLTLFINSKESTKFQVWDCHWSPRRFRVTGDLVWSNPPFADSKLKIDDQSSYHGKIIVTKRGKVPLSVKAYNVQKVGALAMIVIDNGSCQAFDQSCVAGAEKERGERFAVHDSAKAWENIRIPVILLSTADSATFLATIASSNFRGMSQSENSAFASEL